MTGATRYIATQIALAVLLVTVALTLAAWLAPLVALVATGIRCFTGSYRLPASSRPLKGIDLRIRNESAPVLLPEGIFNDISAGGTVHDSRVRHRPIIHSAAGGMAGGAVFGSYLKNPADSRPSLAPPMNSGPAVPPVVAIFAPRRRARGPALRPPPTLARWAAP